ncbi:MAG: Uma2 family endonuclease [Cytophagales bacterium]|jgi:Uma2 family endonuclease|nr:Uma2 family endonuclease [Cytophagales bacterium]MCA6389264.1 Uma2 family endonuclease [Cytophagales bacterium]MCA6392719.1 Uma2 family endonuclease [Cytophagales bacterium]MCA6393565.1 Uma2 family endonuclease [Cytophagales bacterium]MCA6398035.1 Uma2 family endonuclease [Cytophagales bacterium]
MQNATIDRTKEWTVEDFVQLEESNLPCELINGELFMSPAPSLTHQVVSSNLNDILKAYAKKIGGFVAYSPFDVYLDNKNVFQPDLLLVRKQNLAIITERGLQGAPDLAVEIISPSNAFKDRNHKRRLYQKFGVKEYWIVDPGNRTLEIYDFSSEETPILYLVGEGEVTSNLLPGLSFSFADLFTR